MLRRTPLFLALVAALAFAVRFHAIDRFATGYDELFSALEANGLFPALIGPETAFTGADLTAHDSWRGAARACVATDGGNGILYILGLHAWTEAFGNSNLAIRLFSLCCGLVVVLLTYRLALELNGDGTAALFAAGLAALAPMLVDYSQEARGYMLGTALTLQATRLYLRISRSADASVPTLGRYGLLAGLALLVHYYAAYILAAHAAHAMLRHRPRRWLGWGAVAVPLAAACVGAWMLLGGWEGLGNMARHQASYAALLTANPDYDTYYRSATPLHLAQELFVQLLWLSGNSLLNLGPSLRVVALLLAVPAGLLAGLRWAAAKRGDGVLLLILLTAAGPAYTLLLSALSGHTFGMRYYYVMFSAPPVLMLLARGALGWLRAAGALQRLTGGVLLACLVAVMALSVSTFYRFGYRGNNQPEQVAPMAKAVDALAAVAPQARIALVHATDRDAIAFNLHLGPHAARVPQVIDGLSPQRHAVIATLGGEPRVVLRLR